jgi:O-antigen ligase
MTPDTPAAGSTVPALSGGFRELRARRGRPLDAQKVGWLVVTFAAAVVLGAAAGKGDHKAAFLPVVALLAMLFARLPVAGYVAILWSVATFVDIEALPEVGASSLQFMPAEILLWLVVGCLAFMPRAVRRSLAELASQRESLIMGLFVTAVIGGMAVGVENGASVHAALFDVRFMLFYVAFWPALVALQRNRSQVFVLVGAGAVLVVMLQALQVIVGPSRHLFFVSSSELATTLTSDGTGFLRVRPPGLTAVYVVAAFALARVLWGPARHRLLAWGLAGVTLTGVILSLNRNMVLGLALGLCAAALIAPRKHRFAVLVIALGIGLSGFGLLAEGTGLAKETVVSRITSLSNYSGLKTQTLNDRYYEDRIAWRRIRDHPFGGLGWGPDYGAVLISSDDGFLVSQPRSFMHEQYLWIWMRAGIVGLIALVASLVVGIWNGARWCRARSGEADGWIGAGIVVALVALAASSNVAIYLTPPDSIVPLVGVLALAAVLRRNLAREPSR